LGPALGTALRSSLSQSAIFNLPVLRVQGLERLNSPMGIELRAADGMTLTAMPGLGFLKSEAGNGSGERLVYSTSRQDYSGRFQIAPAPLPAVRLTTFIQMSDRQLSFRTLIDPLIAGDHLRWLELELSNW